MIGNITFDKASMNMSYFLYTIKLIVEKGGIISRKEFVKRMADFVGVPAIKDGKENRTAYNKSKLPRYFGFVDITEKQDGSYLTITNRGKEVYDYITSTGDDEPAEQRYAIKRADRDRFIELFLHSVLFDTFGKNNCGAEQSNTDVEAPKIIFKALRDLGRASSEEICYVIFSLNNKVAHSYEEAIETIKSNRKIGINDYKSTMERWGVQNIVQDFKILNIFTDPSIDLIISEKDEETKKNYYFIRRSVLEKYQKEISAIEAVYQPMQMLVASSSTPRAINKWLMGGILGRVSNNKFIFQVDWTNPEMRNRFVCKGLRSSILGSALITAYNNPKNNVYIVLNGIGRNTFQQIFGEYASALERVNDFWLDTHGESQNGVVDPEAGVYLIKNAATARSALQRKNGVTFPSNLQIVGTTNMIEEKNKYDFGFKTCLLENEAETDYGDILEHNVLGLHIKRKNDALNPSNPHVCIGWSVLGDLSHISTKEELGELYDEKFHGKSNVARGQDVGQIWSFLDSLKIGDYVVYADGKTAHIGLITSDYYFEQENPNQDPDYANNKNVKWLKDVAYQELPHDLHRAMFAMRSVFSLNKYKSLIFDILNNKVIELDEQENEIDEYVLIDRAPRTKKTHPLNSILYGAPGTGKTYSTAEYALAIIEDREVDAAQKTAEERAALMSRYKELTRTGQIVFTTFHQSYGYEDFIQGLRPDTESETMKFRPVDGVFKMISDRAMADEENNYVIIIDEINRGNISKIFGELITLIEDDKRWGEANQLSVTLPSGQIFAVPNNLYIVGTMNSADKSISLIDTALRRRFYFIEKAPDYSTIENATLKAVLEKLNQYIKTELRSTDLLIGHAFFIGKTEDDLADVMNGQIIPLLYEYFYDDEARVKRALDCLEGTAVSIDKEYQGRVRVK